MTYISSQLENIYLPDFPEPPSFVADACVAPANPTHENVKNFIDSVQKSNQWFQENYSQHLVDRELILEDLDKLSNDLQDRIERFKRDQRKIYRIADTIDMVIGSVGAVFVAVKTKTIVAVVFFKPVAEKFRDTINVTNVFICVSGVLISLLVCDIVKRARFLV